MKLRTYLKQHGIKQAAFSRRTRIGVVTVNRIVLGQHEPRVSHAIRIVKATDGKVRFEDLVREKK